MTETYTRALIVFGITTIILAILKSRRKPINFLGSTEGTPLMLNVSLGAAAIYGTIRNSQNVLKANFAEADDATHDVVLHDEAGLFSYGFFYSFKIQELESESSRIELRIYSKAAQTGPVVNKYHKAMLERLRQVFAENLDIPTT